MSGYAHADYAAALAEFGTPRLLPTSQSWILTTPIAGFSLMDARGCYPLFSATNWVGLGSDLSSIDDLVSLVVVADPFGDYTVETLRDCFPDLLVNYKEHYVIDLENLTIAPHHARNIRKARVEVELCPQPEIFTNDWLRLYANLVNRHAIQGIAAFSPSSLSAQLQVPGMVMFRAVMNAETVGIVLWYSQGDVGYYHLAAYTDEGYQNGASFALFAQAIAYFKTRLRWLNLGAGAGVTNDGSDGLTRFKSGWASGTRTAYLCGRIFDHAAYQSLVQKRRIVGEGFFPLYRKGEVR